MTPGTAAAFHALPYLTAGTLTPLAQFSGHSAVYSITNAGAPRHFGVRLTPSWRGRQHGKRYALRAAPALDRGLDQTACRTPRIECEPSVVSEWQKGPRSTEGLRLVSDC